MRPALPLPLSRLLILMRLRIRTCVLERNDESHSWIVLCQALGRISTIGIYLYLLLSFDLPQDAA